MKFLQRHIAIYIPLFYAHCDLTQVYTDLPSRNSSPLLRINSILYCAHTGPVYCGLLPVVQSIFLPLVYRVWRSLQPGYPALTQPYSQEYSSHGNRRAQERWRPHGLIQRRVSMQRLRPFSCNATFRHNDRWPRPAETNRRGVLAPHNASRGH